VALVEIYTTPFCGFCAYAKRLLDHKGVAYTEINVMMAPGKRREMTERAGAARTVPQVFVDGAHVGDCEEIYRLDDAGDLDAVLGLGAGRTSQAGP
jgi:glutaredoxin 3